MFLQTTCTHTRMYTHRLAHTSHVHTQIHAPRRIHPVHMQAHTKLNIFEAQKSFSLFLASEPSHGRFSQPAVHFIPPLHLHKLLLKVSA